MLEYVSVANRVGAKRLLLIKLKANGPSRLCSRQCFGTSTPSWWLEFVTSSYIPQRLLHYKYQGCAGAATEFIYVSEFYKFVHNFRVALRVILAQPLYVCTYKRSYSHSSVFVRIHFERINYK